MAHWDGLRTLENSRVLVLAATNRPFDLDDAVIRRLPRRLLVDLPDAENRARIVRVILSKEELEGGHEGFDYDAVGAATEGCGAHSVLSLGFLNTHHGRKHSRHAMPIPLGRAFVF